MQANRQQKRGVRRDRVHPRYLRVGGERVVTAPRLARWAAGLSLYDIFLRLDRRYTLRTLAAYDLNGCDSVVTADTLAPAFQSDILAFLFPRILDREAFAEQESWPDPV